MTFTRVEPTSIDVDQSFTFKNVSVTSNTVSNNLSVNNAIATKSIAVSTSANLGNVSNLKITGGSANLSLLTDGTGNLRWGAPSVDTANTVISSSQPNITSVGTLTSFAANNGTLNGSVPYTFTTNWNNSSVTFSALEVRVTDTLSTNSSTLLNLTVGNVSRFSVNKLGAISSNSISVTGNVSAAFVSGTITTAAQPNITSLGQLSVLNVTGNINAGNIILSGGIYGPINGSIGAITPNVGTFTNVIVNNNITASGNLVAGNGNLGNVVRANFYYGDGGFLSNIKASGTASANYANYANIANISGTVTSSAQPNITSLGNLTSLIITGNLTAGNANLGNAVRGNFFIGNGSLLTSINGTNVSGQVPNALVAGTLYSSSQPNITSVGNLTSLNSNSINTASIFANSITVKSSKEQINFFTPPGGVYASATLDANSGTIWWLNDTANMNATFTVNFSNVANTLTDTTVFIVLVEQGASPKPISQVQVNGSTPYVKWLGGITPTVTANSFDVYTFTVIPVFARALPWIVTAQYNTYI